MYSENSCSLDKEPFLDFASAVAATGAAMARDLGELNGRKVIEIQKMRIDREFLARSRGLRVLAGGWDLGGKGRGLEGE